MKLVLILIIIIFSFPVDFEVFIINVLPSVNIKLLNDHKFISVKTDKLPRENAAQPRLFHLCLFLKIIWIKYESQTGNFEKLF